MANSTKCCCFGKGKTGPKIPREIKQARKAYKTPRPNTWTLERQEALHVQQRTAFWDRIKKQLEVERSGSKGQGQGQNEPESLNVLKQIILIEEARDHYCETSKRVQLSAQVPVKCEYLDENSRLGDYALWILEMMKKYEKNESPLILECGGRILREFQQVLEWSYSVYDLSNDFKNWKDEATRNLPPRPSPELLEWTLSYSGPFWEVTSDFLLTLFLDLFKCCDDGKENVKENVLRIFQASIKNIANLSKQNVGQNGGDGADFSSYSVKLMNLLKTLLKTSEVSSVLIWDTEDAFSTLSFALLIYGKSPRSIALTHVFYILSLIVPQDKSGDFSRYWESQEFVSLLKSLVPNVLRCGKMEFTPFRISESLSRPTMHTNCAETVYQFSRWLNREGEKPGFCLIFRRQDFLGSVIEVLDILATDSDWKNDPESKEGAVDLTISALFVLSKVNDEEYTRNGLKRMSRHLLNFEFKILAGFWSYSNSFGNEKLGQIQNYFQGLKTSKGQSFKDQNQTQTQSGSGVQKIDGAEEVEAAIKIIQYLQLVEQLIAQEEEENTEKWTEEKKEKQNE